VSNEKINDHTQQLQADIFKLLAACFYKPEKEVLIDNDLPGTLVSLVKNVSDKAHRGAMQMKEAVKKYSIEELQVEYTRLFLGPFGVAVPPYGSCYLEKSGEVMGKTTQEIMHLYRKAGLAIDKEFTELPDHIAVELEFVYYLLTNKLVLVKTPDQKKQGIDLDELYNIFTGSYLLPFIQALTNRMFKESTNEYFTGLAICLREIARF